MSEVHATIPKGIVGGFEGTVRSSKKFERMVREATDICLRVLKESNKSRFDSFSRYEQCIDHIPYYLSGLSRAHFFQQPFSKQLYTVRTIRLSVISPFGTLGRGVAKIRAFGELWVPPKKSWLRPCLYEMQHENT